MSGPRAALHFLTLLRLPGPPSSRGQAPLGPTHGLAWFAAVGWLLGLLLAALDWLLRRGLPPGVATALDLAAMAVVVGGLHWDGLADSADGILGGRDAGQRLAIMRDERVGTFGVLAVALVLLTQWSALASAGGAMRPWLLAAAPAVARAALVPLAAVYPNARPGGLASGLRDAARRPAPLIASGIVGLAAGSAVGPVGLALLPVGVLTALATGAWAERAIGGITGDVLGASVELGQAAVWVVGLWWLRAGWLHGW